MGSVAFRPAMAVGGIFNVQSIVLAIVLVAAVFVFFWLYQKNAKPRPQKPGRYLRYKTPTLNAATCRGILGKTMEHDLFSYQLETASTGGWYIRFSCHNPTSQPLDTLFLLQFEDDSPAVFSLTFAREAFGMREPIIAETLLDDFFAQKLGAVRFSSPDLPKPS